MSYRNIIVFLLLITFQVNYIATRFLLYDTAAKSVCSSLGLEQASHPGTWRLSPPPPMASGPPISVPSVLFLQWVLGLGGAVVFRIHLPPHSGRSAQGGSVGIGAPPPGFSPKPGLPTVAQPRGLSWVSPSGLTAPAGLSWEPFQETGPAVGPGDGDRTVSVQGSGGLGSECHGVAEPPHPTVVHPFNSWHNPQQVGAYSVPQEQCSRVGAFLGAELPPEVPCENRTSDRGRAWDLSRGPDQKNQQKCTSRDAAWLAD